MENTYKITRNATFKSTEITFEVKPTATVRDALKALRYRWHSVKNVWYGYTDEETVKTAIENAMNGKPTAKTAKAVKKAEKVNKYGVKVGDVFHMSWGYEQTNADFFQVVALCGDESVRVVEVSPEIIKRDATCAMAENRTYRITSELIKPDSRSVFIKDNVKGDIKRIKTGLYTEGRPYIKVGDHLASKVDNGEYTTYVSWYY